MEVTAKGGCMTERIIKMDRSIGLMFVLSMVAIGNVVGATKSTATVSAIAVTDITGTVQSIDRNNGHSRIRLRDMQGTISEYMLDDHTLVFREQKQISLSEIEVGDHLTLRQK